MYSKLLVKCSDSCVLSSKHVIDIWCSKEDQYYVTGVIIRHLKSIDFPCRCLIYSVEDVVLLATSLDWYSGKYSHWSVYSHFN